jgi:hypothetical protein
MNCAACKQAAAYDGPLDDEIRTAARRVADAWSKLDTRLSGDQMPTAEEADESWQDTLYDQACLLLERMAARTQERFFAHINQNDGHQDLVKRALALVEALTCVERHRFFAEIERRSGTTDPRE